ncbi:unnamed protein product [Caenorhabditis auriculariae]|uniref:Uncharacterized protein n=1 Tax=Caenorhabditis auriculariae TaxID=2777116 RepID=A0A8S1HCV8_9PELO|nr:unnamed protein product [Caenorhabditis auriculariae]
MHVISLAVLILFLDISCASRDNLALAWCPWSTHRRCTDGLTCIQKSWMCDGRVDCGDASDELPHLCHKRGSLGKLPSGSRIFVSIARKCPQSWFFCQDAKACIQPNLVCDGKSDCRDGSDETLPCYEFRQRKRSTALP